MSIPLWKKFDRVKPLPARTFYLSTPQGSTFAQKLLTAGIDWGRGDDRTILTWFSDARNCQPVFMNYSSSRVLTAGPQFVGPGTRIVKGRRVASLTPGNASFTTNCPGCQAIGYREGFDLCDISDLVPKHIGFEVRCHACNRVARFQQELFCAIEEIDITTLPISELFTWIETVKTDAEEAPAEARPRNCPTCHRELKDAWIVDRRRGQVAYKCQCGQRLRFGRPEELAPEPICPKCHSGHMFVLKKYYKPLANGRFQITCPCGEVVVYQVHWKQGEHGPDDVIVTGVETISRRPQSWRDRPSLL